MLLCEFMESEYDGVLCAFTMVMVCYDGVWSNIGETVEGDEHYGGGRSCGVRLDCG